MVRFKEEASFATKGVVIYGESLANGGRKSPLKRINPKDFNLK